MSKNLWKFYFRIFLAIFIISLVCPEEKKYSIGDNKCVPYKIFVSRNLSEKVPTLQLSKNKFYSKMFSQNSDGQVKRAQRTRKLVLISNRNCTLESPINWELVSPPLLLQFFQNNNKGPPPIPPSPKRIYFILKRFYICQT